MEKKKQNIYPAIFIWSSIILILTLGFWRKNYVNNEIEKSNNHVIAQFTLKDRGAKTTSFFFAYFFNGKKLVTARTGINYDILNSDLETQKINNLKLNSFYSAKFNPEYPDVIIVNPDQEVTDTVAILKAGFSSKDLKKMTPR